MTDQQRVDDTTRSPSTSPTHEDGGWKLDPVFDKPDAEVILQSSDGVQFRVFKAPLRLASPFFETMFSLPAEQNEIITTPDIPVVHCAEHSNVLQIVLKYCYPGKKPVLEDVPLDIIWKCLDASIKLEMGYLEERLRGCFVDLVYKHPMACFTIAVQKGWTDHIHLAAKVILQYPLPLGKRIPELRNISAYVLHQLVDYHIRCGLAAADAISLPNVTRAIAEVRGGPDLCFFACKNTESTTLLFNEDSPELIALRQPPARIKTTADTLVPLMARSTPRWFRTFLQHMQAAVRTRPCPFLTLSTAHAGIVNDGIAAGELCALCAPRVGEDLGYLLSKHLQRMVKQAVEEVSFQLEV